MNYLKQVKTNNMFTSDMENPNHTNKKIKTVGYLKKEQKKSHEGTRSKLPSIYSPTHSKEWKV